MRTFYYVLSMVAAAFLLAGCYTASRIERELYTITLRDTTMRQNVNNVPGERDNGTIYPTSRQVEIERGYVQKDSTVERFYPAFLRYGGVEAASFMGTGGSGKGTGLGLFGLYDLFSGKRPADSKTFTADMYRFLPYEWRLRWFDDAPDWTFGISAVEVFLQHNDSSAETEPGERLMGFASPYFRKRFFFREEPPYVMLVPFVGFGLIPSQYLNVGASLDIGSYGGFNLRAYGGYITGTSLFLPDEDDPDQLGDYSASFPYFGVGVSALDFVNRTEELFIEWKDHDHNAVEVSALNFDLVYSTTSGAGSWFNPPVSGDTSGAYPTGFILKFGSANFPLPIGKGELYVGTSLFSGLILSQDEIAYGWLPFRAGYRTSLFHKDLSVEPFTEVIYYPQTAFQLGGRVSLKLPDFRLPILSYPIPLRLNGSVGYVSGSANTDVLSGFEDLAAPADFSTLYFSIGLGIGDVFHTPEEVRRK